METHIAGLLLSASRILSYRSDLGVSVSCRFNEGQKVKGKSAVEVSYIYTTPPQ